MHVHPYERLWIRISVGAAGRLRHRHRGEQPRPWASRSPARRRVPWRRACRPTPPADKGWVRELGPGRYEVNLVARMWGFDPNEIRIPKGSTVTFYVHSQDVIHGIKIQDTTVSMMVIPGQVGRATYTFDEPGEYLFVCHEYCGLGHHVMSGKVIVEG